MSDMDAYRDMFLAESSDYLQQITDGLLDLEGSPDDPDPVETVFRGAHSLKGMAAAMGYERTADLAHKMEGLMDRVRRGERVVESGTIDAMLAAVDVVRELIGDESEGRANVDPSRVMEMLTSMAEEPSVAVEADTVSPIADSDPEPHLLPGERVFRLRVTLESGCVLKAVRGYMVLKRVGHVGRVLGTVPSALDIEDERFDHEFTVIVATVEGPDLLHDAVMHVSEVESVDIEETVVPPHAPESAAAGPALRSGSRRELPRPAETQSVRVAIGHLDTFVELVGELVILRSRLERIASAYDDQELKETVEDMYSISSELQYEVMQTRMVPVGNIFKRFPRMVRDLAADLGKQIDFTIEGLDIELDRTVLDEIGDPIVHLLRNSVDHGIETSEVRIAAGKPERGAIRLSAERERDHVSIIVSDDGEGMDLARVWDEACRLGLARPEDRDEYSDAEILRFTCLPGFTTAQHATRVSGRGVGMDVVKGKIEHLGGTLRIDSTPGSGTDFVLTLPLTLAVVKALFVMADGQMFALPLSSVTEVFAADEVSVDTIDGVLVVVLRDGSIVPLRSLGSILFGKEGDARPQPRSVIVLVVAGGERHALLVESLGGRDEIVIKPLSHLLEESRGFSGATILGDGRVILILDPRTMFSPTEGPR